MGSTNFNQDNHSLKAIKEALSGRAEEDFNAEKEKKKKLVYKAKILSGRDEKLVSEQINDFLEYLSADTKVQVLQIQFSTTGGDSRIVYSALITYSYYV